MPQPITILYTPLPQGSASELHAWRSAFETALEPRLDARQWEHVNRFGRAAGQQIIEAALSRLMARAQIVTAAALSSSGAPLPQITMDSRGRPQFAGWRTAFSHSGQAAFCALAQAEQPAAPALGLDAEALTAPPPHSSAFAAGEISAPMALHGECWAREALRRWTIKEALLKAAGLGLGMQPDQVPTGRFGQRSGLWDGPLGPLGWRTVACPAHWLCVAQTGNVPTPQIFLQWHNPRDLLHRLARLRPQP